MATPGSEVFPATLDDLLDLDRIRQIRPSYSYFFDMGDIDSLMGLFAADPVCELPAEFGGTWTGTRQLRENFARFMHGGRTKLHALHVVSNPYVRLSGPGTARGRWYLVVFHADIKNPLFRLGYYDDEYCKENGVWKLKRQRLEIAWSQLGGAA